MRLSLLLAQLGSFLWLDVRLVSRVRFVILNLFLVAIRCFILVGIEVRVVMLSEVPRIISDSIWLHL